MDISRLIEVNNSNEFYGIYHHRESVYRLSLKIPEFPLMKRSQIKILKDLQNFIVAYEDTDSIDDFFSKFEVAVNVCKQKQLKSEETVLQQKRKDILDELTLLSRQETYDVFVAADLSTVKFYDKIHFLTLSLTNNLEVEVLEHSLPEKHKWFQSSIGTVTSFFNEFTKALEELEEFYKTINSIDELCFVIDPLEPSTKSNSRIFKVEQKCYMKLVIDPLLPSSITATFIGPTLLVEKYRNKYEQQIVSWDHDLDVHKNLLKICEIVAHELKATNASRFQSFTENKLDRYRQRKPRISYRGLVYFPMRNDQDEEDALNCSICGTFRMDNTIPMISCDNLKCDLVFHVGCLKQWWSMVADTKTFLYIELGTTCPMCKEKLSTSFEQLFTDREN